MINLFSRQPVIPGYELHYRVEYEDGHAVYVLIKEIRYFSKRYQKWVIVEDGFRSDGASGPAPDLASWSWWVHDKVCDTGKFDDGSACTSWQGSMMLYDILWAEQRYGRAVAWGVATYVWQKLRGKN
jgi:hypothetical protein